jgi:hypothetical protein
LLPYLLPWIDADAPAAVVVTCADASAERDDANSSAERHNADDNPEQHDADADDRTAYHCTEPEQQVPRVPVLGAQLLLPARSVQEHHLPCRPDCNLLHDLRQLPPRLVHSSWRRC